MEREGEGEAEVEGQGEAEVESEGELRHDHGVRDQSSQEVDIGDQREESEGRATESEEEKEEYGQRVVTSRRRDIIESGSDRSEEIRYGDNDEEVDQARSPRWFLSGSNIFKISSNDFKRCMCKCVVVISSGNFQNKGKFGRSYVVSEA